MVIGQSLSKKKKLSQCIISQNAIKTNGRLR